MPVSLSFHAAKSFLGQLGTDLSGLLFPKLCAGCADNLRVGEQAICMSCRLELPPAYDFDEPAENASARVFWGRIPFRGVGAGFVFSGKSRLQEIIHQLKYNSRSDAGVELGKTVGRKLIGAHPFCTAECIIPVPLHEKRLRERGYNQAAEFGRGLSQVLNIPLQENVLFRLQATRTQTRKTRAQRWENVSDVFAVRNEAEITGRHILLVDDVLTTGATLEAAASPLLAIQGVSVSIVTIAAARN
ncbi:MAG: ComF family protein [Bacteroidetes bacterium]|nr:ComF family protein [Bacteroidota bacterium]